MISICQRIKIFTIFEQFHDKPSINYWKVILNSLVLDEMNTLLQSVLNTSILNVFKYHRDHKTKTW